MINIKAIEEIIMIEVNDWNYPLSNLINDVMISGENLSKEEAYKYASNVAGSLFIEGYIKLEKATYEREDEDIYSFISKRDCTQKEIDYLLKESDTWNEEEIMSPNEVYELAITEKGREYPV